MVEEEANTVCRSFCGDKGTGRCNRCQVVQVVLVDRSRDRHRRSGKVEVVLMTESGRGEGVKGC